MTEPQFITQVDSLDDLLTRDGFYETTSEHPAYAVLKTLAWHPEVTVTEEFSASHATLRALVKAAEGDLAPNSSMEAMGYDPRYFTGLLDGYLHWEMAWFREVIQNARDAIGPNAPSGPANIDIVCRVESYTDVDGVTVDAMRVECSDDGNGMDEPTLRNAFLMFGGSMKPPGGFGGFGDAKGLIILPWLGYEIHTSNLVARGRHNLFRIDAARESRKGTRVTVWMPLSKATTPENAIAFVERCNLPEVRIRVNGKTVKAALAAKSEDRLREFPQHIRAQGNRVGVIDAYHNSRAKRQGIYIRQTDDRGRSVFMFERPVYSDKFKGLVLVELYGSPRVLFDQKRNALNWATDTNSIVEGFVQKLIVDPKTTLKRSKGKMRAVFGREALDVQAGIASEIAAEMALDVPVDRMKKYGSGAEGTTLLEFTDDQLGAIQQKLEDVSTDMPQTGGGVGVPTESVVRAVPDAVVESMRATKFLGASHAAEAMRMAAWKPVFMMINEVDFYTVPKKLLPGTMADQYKDLATAWTEICRFVLIRLGWSEPFGVGFIFEWDPKRGATTLAAYTRDTETVDPSGAERTPTELPFLLLNPVKLTIESREYDGDGEHKSIKYNETIRWDLRDYETVKGLCAAAVHEATHMVNGISEHDESFASALTDNMATLFDMLPVAQKIVDKVSGKKGREKKEKRTSKRGREMGDGEIKDLLRPSSLRDPKFYRLWALWIAARMELPAINPDELPKLGSAYARVIGARMRAAQHTAGAALLDDIRRFSPMERGPLSPSLVAPLTAAGQQAWSGFMQTLQRETGTPPQVAMYLEDEGGIETMMSTLVTLGPTAEFAKKAAR